MSNNDQWLFENTPRVRYSTSGLIRDNGIKIIAGKSVVPAQDREWSDCPVYFGSFFSAGCKPIVTATVETTNGRNRRYCTLRGLGGEIDSRGMIIHVVGWEPGNNLLNDTSYVHWQAIGY